MATDVWSANAGVVHWGAVPNGVFVGSFTWLPVNLTSGWSFAIDSVTVGAVTVPGGGYVATVDPGIDTIVMPSMLADKMLQGVEGAVRSVSDTTVWVRACRQCSG